MGSTVSLFEHTPEEITDLLNRSKLVLLQAMADEGIITPEHAHGAGKNLALLFVKRHWLSRLFSKDEEDNYRIIAVKMTGKTDDDEA